jgi:superfamily I DNA/RNA helicase/RecB family exonuclease
VTTYTLVPGRPVAVQAPALTVQQRRVVEHRDGPLLVLAGPGTGKTTTLVEAVTSRIEGGDAPEEILVLTFSRKAAADLRRRIAARLGGSVVTPRAMTFHAFCRSVVRRYGDPELYGPAVRLLTAPEQEFRIREVLDGAGASAWPPGFQNAFRTRGFAAEVRAGVAAVRQLGLDADLLRDHADLAGRPEWYSLGTFFDEYLDVLESEQVLDYAELVHRTRVILADPEISDAVRRSARVVYVDEYQDTDPSQVALLGQLAGAHGDLVVIGDPDQAIYEFRGARPRGILDFPDEFTTAGGLPAPVVALDETYRFGSVLAAASRRIADRLPLPRAIGDEVRKNFRSPRSAPSTPSGVVEVYTYDDAGAEADHVADLLQRAHLHDGVPWDDMAVLVRSGRRQLPVISRALVAAGIPVRVAGDEIGLASAESVRAILLALDVATRPGGPDVAEAAQLLESPLGGLDSVAVRRIGRALREAERADLAGAGLPRSSGELLRLALIDPERFDDCPPLPEIASARSLANLLQRVGTAVNAGLSAHEGLWELWQGTAWPQRLTAHVAAGGASARHAHRDLDALVALFQLAAHSDAVVGRRGVTAFLAEVDQQQIPADSARESEVRTGGVRVLTAHRAKGLEWPLVVVSGVQEGVWPDVRRRSTLLEVDRIDVSGPGEPPTPATLLASERRLFYVACTRASRRLVVTAVAGVEGEGDQPSRFLGELGVEALVVRGRPRRPLTLAAVVADLRRAALDPTTHPAARLAAEERLAMLADARDARGRLLAPTADPRRWWGLHELTTGGHQGPRPFKLSGSQVGSLLACPRQWFLSRRASADARRTSAAGFGTLVHTLAEHATRTGVDPTELAAHLDRVWDQVPFEAPWQADREREEAASALERLGVWNDSVADRRVLGAEVSFEIDVRVRDHDVTLTGTVDRLDLDALGRLHIVDFKTGRSAPSGHEVAALDQLGVYQLAARSGAFDDRAPGAGLGGASLVYLRLPSGTGSSAPKVLHQASLDDRPHLDREPELAMLSEEDRQAVGSQTDHETWVHHRLATAATVLSRDRYVATRGPACQWCPFTSSCPAVAAGKQVIR